MAGRGCSARGDRDSVTRRSDPQPIRLPLPPKEALADLMKVPPPPDKKRRGGKTEAGEADAISYAAEIVIDKQPEKPAPGTLSVPGTMSTGRCPYRSAVPQRVGAPKKKRRKK